MKAVTILLRSTFALLIIQFIACEKVIDFARAKNCRIKKIHFFIQYENADYDVDFYYNKWGDPDSVIINPTQMENPNLYFIYNSKKQLKEFQHAWAFGFPAILHRFGYSRGVITTDTIVSFYTQVPFHSITYFEYDRYGRISKSTYIPTGLPPYYILVNTYEYDSEGNLIRPSPYPPLTYDHKLNPQQLHPVWQFIARDYSLNNPTTALHYNNFGLPTKFDQPRPSLFFNYFSFLGNSLNALDRSEIVYECK